MDRVYLVLLEYFVLKGMLEGELGSAGAARPRAALLLFGLLHHLAVLAGGPQGDGLAGTPAGAALLETERRYDAIRRRWPRGLRYVLLAPVRSMVLPRY